MHFIRYASRGSISYMRKTIELCHRNISKYIIQQFFAQRNQFISIRLRPTVSAVEKHTFFAPEIAIGMQFVAIFSASARLRIAFVAVVAMFRRRRWRRFFVVATHSAVGFHNKVYQNNVLAYFLNATPRYEYILILRKHTAAGKRHHNAADSAVGTGKKNIHNSPHTLAVGGVHNLFGTQFAIR